MSDLRMPEGSCNLLIVVLVMDGERTSRLPGYGKDIERIFVLLAVLVSFD